MKKNICYLIPVLFILLASCSADDGPVADPLEYEKVAILSTNLPAELTEGQKINLRLTYERPTSCHRLSSIEYEELKGALYFTIVTSYPKAEDCENEDLTGSTSFEFTPEPVDFYIFKFWQGENEQGEDMYLTVQVPVKANST
jgi:hypothetical protein